MRPDESAQRSPFAQDALRHGERYQVAFVRGASILFAAGAVVSGLVHVSKGYTERLPGLVPFVALGLIGLWLLSRGRTRRAILWLTYGAWICVLNGILWTGALHAPSLLALPLVIVFSAWLAGSRTAAVFVMVTLLFLLFLAHAGTAGWPWPAASASYGDYHTAFVYSLSTVAAGILGHYAARSNDQYISQLRESERALQAKVGELEARDRELASSRVGFESMFRTSPNAAAIASARSGTIVDCNEAFVSLVGIARDGIVGVLNLAEGLWEDGATSGRLRAAFAGAVGIDGLEARFVSASQGVRDSLVGVRMIEQDGERRVLAQIVDVTPLRKAQEAVRLSEEKFSLAFHASPDAMSLTRLRDGIIVEVNEAFVRNSGYSRAQIVGHTSEELNLWRDRGERARIVEELLAGRTVIDAPFSARHRDGTPIACRFSGAVIGIGGERHLLSISRNVTEEERTRAALAQRERDLDAANRSLAFQVSLHKVTEQIARVGHWTSSRSRDRLEWSDSFFDLCGVPRRGPMAAEEYRSLIRIEDQTEFDRAREGLDGVPAVYQITRPDGSRRWLRASLHRPPDAPPGADECLGVAQDVTEEHEAKLALVRLNAELERRVAERTAELRAANEELDAFAYSIAHDLTGPLRSINGFAALLERDAGDRLDEESRSDLARIRKSSLRMASLISDLLQLSRLTRATVQRERVDLSSLAREVAEELGATQPDRRVEWRIRDGLLADADAGLARALLQNLLGNAWKYTRDRADPVIELGLAEAQPGSNEFFVRDNGAGFDMTGASRLFTPFQRLHSAEEFEGSGIGLATVQRIVRRHGGKVRAQGEVGRGATFYFTLPASA